MATATIKAHPVFGAILRLTNDGFRFASIALPVQRGEEPTEAADRALTEHGWRAGAWEQPTGRDWVTEIELTEGP